MDENVPKQTTLEIARNMQTVKDSQNIDPLKNFINQADSGHHGQRAQEPCVLPPSTLRITVDREVQSPRGLCHCCLELPCLKGLWQTYEWMGCSEKYGEMLLECFGLDLSAEQNAKICEVCITQLRNAVRFRAQVARCHTQLLERRARDVMKADDWQTAHQSKNVKKVIKVEHIADADDALEHYVYDESLEQLLPVKSEGCGDASSINVEEINNDISNDIKEIPETLKKIKPINRRLKGRKRILLLKNCSKIDRRTIAFQSNRFTKPRRNVGLLLEHSTTCPFRYNQTYFQCFYCSRNYLLFEELRSHVKDCHNNLSFKDIVKCITRPNDRIKVDVSEITCRTCNRKCMNMDELVAHLTESHSISFDGNPVDSILSYDLADNKFKCTVCKEEFLFFKTLGKHMNEHTSNHVCDVCGKCFLLIERLRAHMPMHAADVESKCEYCDKMFPTKQTLSSHVNYVHKKKPCTCSICGESFPTYRKRLKHFVEKHGRAPVSWHCDQCDRTFNSKSNLHHHIRHQHEMVPKEAKYSCGDCERKFTSKRVLADHVIVHSSEKKYECDVCKKKFGRLNSLKEHIKIHKNDKRWSCGACAVCFVQKCSLKNHIRVHHAEYNLTDLIVHKNPNK